MKGKFLFWVGMFAWASGLCIWFMYRLWCLPAPHEVNTSLFLPLVPPEASKLAVIVFDYDCEPCKRLEMDLIKHSVAPNLVKHVYYSGRKSNPNERLAAFVEDSSVSEQVRIRNQAFFDNEFKLRASLAAPSDASLKRVRALSKLCFSAGIRSTPTVVLFKKGLPPKVAQSIDEINQFLAKS